MLWKIIVGTILLFTIILMLLQNYTHRSPSHENYYARLQNLKQFSHPPTKHHDPNYYDHIPTREFSSLHDRNKYSGHRYLQRRRRHFVRQRNAQQEV